MRGNHSFESLSFLPGSIFSRVKPQKTCFERRKAEGVLSDHCVNASSAYAEAQHLPVMSGWDLAVLQLFRLVRSDALVHHSRERSDPLKSTIARRA
jgi:hypothetical protein